MKLTIFYFAERHSAEGCHSNKFLSAEYFDALDGHFKLKYEN
jgi:hypothetical protein